MAGDTGCGIYPAVDFMLVEIIAPVRQRPIRRIFKLVAGLDLFIVPVAVGAEGLRMADIAGLLALRRVELMLFDVIRPVVQMVQCRPPIGMTFAAQGHIPDLNGMLQYPGTGNSTAKQKTAGQDQYYENECFTLYFHLMISPEVVFVWLFGSFTFFDRGLSALRRGIETGVKRIHQLHHGTGIVLKLRGPAVLYVGRDPCFRRKGVSNCC